MASKSVEQKLYESYTRNEQCRLSRGDVEDLLGNDDAIKRRITDAACREAGVEEAGCDETYYWVRHGEDSWEQFKSILERKYSGCSNFL
jgi:hypothetical protein